MRSTISLALAGASWGLLTVALLLPLLIGAPPDALVFASAFVVGIQAAQSAYIQIAPAWRLSRLAIMSLYAGSLVLASASTWASESFALAVGGTASGALIGLPYGAQALTALDVRGGLAYQLFQTARSAAVAIGVLALASVWTSALYLAGPILIATTTLVGTALSAAFWAILGRIIVPSELASDPHRPAARPAITLLLLGLAASLLYRNDTTWLRASLASVDDFDEWHIALVAYSAIQGLVGFLVIQRLFANRAGLRPVLARMVRVCRWPVVLGWPLCGALAIAASSVIPLYWSVAVAAALAIMVGAMSGAAHVLVLNWAPYVAGVIGTGTLLGLLALNADPRLVLATSNTAIGFVLVIVLSWKGAREWNS